MNGGAPMESLHQQKAENREAQPTDIPHEIIGLIKRRMLLFPGMGRSGSYGGLYAMYQISGNHRCGGVVDKHGDHGNDFDSASAYISLLSKEGSSLRGVIICIFHGKSLSRELSKLLIIQ